MLLLNPSSIASAHQSLCSHSPIIPRLSQRICTVFTSSSSSSSPSSISSLSVSLHSGVSMAAIFSSSTSSDFQEDKQTLTSVTFQPFVEIQDHLVMVPSSSSASLARQNFSESCEAALNEQINIEYNASYFYHNLFAYFDRDNVGLPGLAKFFKESSDEEREHAKKIMKYQSKRGGKVILNKISFPTITEFKDAEKGDALTAMELTLAMEKLVNKKLLRLHKVAEVAGDPQLADFVKVELLKPQVDDIKKISSYVSQLRRIGKGHGVYHFDLMLL